MKIILNSNDYNDTILIASSLAKLLKKQDIILLNGDLGAGKTVFAKGIGKGLGIKETIISPTFNIVRCYFSGTLNLYHIDAYRLEGNNSDIGLDEYLFGDGITLVEWPIYIDYLIPSSYLKITISIIDENKREIVLESFGKRYDDLLGEFSNAI